MAPPLEPTTVNADHVLSGVGVLPVWTLMVRLVPAGVSAVHASAPHATDPFASKTRETNVVDAAYGLICTQSTRTLLRRPRRRLPAAPAVPGGGTSGARAAGRRRKSLRLAHSNRFGN